MIPLEQVKAQYKDDRATFEQAYRVPVLVYRPPRTTEEPQEVNGGRTVKAEALDLSRGYRFLHGLPLVLRVAHKPNSPFPIISLGRNSQNDIKIEDDPAISRVHAYFTPGEDGYCISDNTSSNGTFVDGKELKPKIPHQLKNGNTIRFGGLESKLEFTYYTPDGFREHLEFLSCAPVSGSK